jgi:hypothetical protein
MARKPAGRVVRHGRRLLCVGLLTAVTAGTAAGSVSAHAPTQAERAARFQDVAVAPPQPPTSYALPEDALVVSTSTGLRRALQGSRPRDIVLADGTYDNPSPFVDANGSHIYAEHLGGAVVTAGISLGGNFGDGGGSVQGLTFDVANPAATLDGGIVHVWGPGGRNSAISDCVFRGNGVVPVGVLAYDPAGLRVQRSEFFDFTDEAIRASDNVAVPYGHATPVIDTITDIEIDHVSRPVPGSSDGTAEAGIWIGNPVANGVARIRIRNVSWSGIETVNDSWNTTFSDLDIDMSGPYQYAGVGVYLEHYNRDNTFERFTITGAKIGFNGEWADPAWGGVAAAHGTVIQDGVVDSAGSSLPGRQAGVYLDAGTVATTVRDVAFRNQNWAGIGAYANVGTNFVGNDFSWLRPGAVGVSYQHI